MKLMIFALVMAFSSNSMAALLDVGSRVTVNVDICSIAHQDIVYLLKDAQAIKGPDFTTLDDDYVGWVADTHTDITAGDEYEVVSEANTLNLCD
jgi:hypothetical protein